MAINSKSWPLKPCPFCGAEAAWCDWTFSWRIHCTKCTAQMEGKSVWRLQRKWNTRKHEAPQSKLPTPKESWFEIIVKETKS